MIGLADPGLSRVSREAEPIPNLKGAGTESVLSGFEACIQGAKGSDWDRSRLSPVLARASAEDGGMKRHSSGCLAAFLP